MDLTAYAFECVRSKTQSTDYSLTKKWDMIDFQIFDVTVCLFFILLFNLLLSARKKNTFLFKTL